MTTPHCDRCHIINSDVATRQQRTTDSLFIGNSTRLVTEFDIPAESAWNIMGIGFVIPHRLQPDSRKKN